MSQQARASMARLLGLNLALLEAEVRLRQDLTAAGILPANPRRQPTVLELRSGVRFAELDRIVNDAAALISRKADPVRAAILDGLAEQLADAFGEPDPYKVQAKLDAFANPTTGTVLPGVRDAIAKAAKDIRGDLLATARAGVAEALDEAKRQGIPDHLIAPVDPIDATVSQAADVHAQRVAQSPAQRLLQAAAEAGQRAATAQGATGGDVFSAALDAAEQASRATTDDLAKQAANVAHGLGRTRALEAIPAPTEVYASELLDRNTCGPCATVDGRTYATLADALVDYPGAGGFIGCDGGSRCRGTLVLVHGTEAPPTLDNPGPGAPGGPADRTPRGPASPAPAPATGPMQPDPGVGPLPATPSAALTDSGATVMPVEQLDTPIDTVTRAERTDLPDRIYAARSDAELERMLADPFNTDAQRVAIADELDGRAAGTFTRQSWEDNLSAAELDQLEHDRRAWEAAGGDAADAYAANVAKPTGRRIDRIRTEWAEQLEMDYLAAEDATRGSLLRRDRLAEYRAKYGTSTAPLMEGPARVAYHYASPELRDYWESIGGRPSFAEFAVQRGITDAKTVARAKAAARAREDARRMAEEDAGKRAARRAQRRTAPLSAGERLEQERRRLDRIRARERRLQAEAGYVEPTPIPEPIPAPAPEPAPAPAPEPAPPPAPSSPAPGMFTPEELSAALSPARKRTKAAILKELEATKHGKDLAASIKAFTETRGGVANLRANIAKTLDGTASAPVKARVEAFLDAMRTYPVDEVPTLFRGIAVKVEEDSNAWWDAFEAQFKPGSTIDLNASSFTSNEKKAAEFERMIGGTRKVSGNYTAVRFVLEGDTHALPVETLSKFKSEKEWITGGQFEVVDFTPGTPAQPYARVVIRQRKALGDDQ